MDVDGTRGPSLRDRLYRLAYSGNTLTSHAHSPRTYTAVVFARIPAQFRSVAPLHLSQPTLQSAPASAVIRSATRRTAASALRTRLCRLYSTVTSVRPCTRARRNRARALTRRPS